MRRSADTAPPSALLDPPNRGLVRVLTPHLAPFASHYCQTRWVSPGALSCLTEPRRISLVTLFEPPTVGNVGRGHPMLVLGPSLLAQCLRRQPIEVIRLADIRIGAGRGPSTLPLQEYWLTLDLAGDDYGSCIRWLCTGNREQALWYLWLTAQQTAIPESTGQSPATLAFPPHLAASLFPCIRECQQIAPAAAAFYDLPEAHRMVVSNASRELTEASSASQRQHTGTIASLLQAEVALRAATNRDYEDELLEDLKSWVLSGMAIAEAGSGSAEEDEGGDSKVFVSSQSGYSLEGGGRRLFSAFVDSISTLTYEIVVGLLSEVEQTRHAAATSTALVSTSMNADRSYGPTIETKTPIRRAEVPAVIQTPSQAIIDLASPILPLHELASSNQKESPRRRGVSFYSTLTTNTAQLTKSTAGDGPEDGGVGTQNTSVLEEADNDSSFFMPLLNPTDEAFRGPSGATSMLFTGDSRIGLGVREEGGAYSSASIGTRTTTTTSTLKSNRSLGSGDGLARTESKGRLLEPQTAPQLGGNSVMQVEDNEVEAREMAAHVLVSLHTELPPPHSGCTNMERAMHAAKRAYIKASTRLEGEMDLLLQPMFTPYNKERGAFAEEWGLSAMAVEDSPQPQAQPTQSPVVLLPNAGTLTLYLPKSRLQKLVGETSSRLQQLTNGGFVRVSEEGAKPDLKSRIDRFSLVNDHINIVRQFDLRTLVDITPTQVEFHEPAIFSDTKILDRENARDLHEAAKRKSKSEEPARDARLTALGRRTSRIDSFASPYIWSKSPHSAKESLFGPDGASRVTTRMHKYRCYGSIGLRLAFAVDAVTDLDALDQRLYRIPHIIVNLTFVTAKECSLFWERISLLSSRFMVAALRDEAHVLKPYWYDPSHPEDTTTEDEEALKGPTIIDSSVADNAKEALTAFMSRFNKIKKEALRKGREVGLDIAKGLSDSEEEGKEHGHQRLKLTQLEKDQLYTAQLETKAPHGLVVTLFVDNFLTGAPPSAQSKNPLMQGVAKRLLGARQRGEDDEDDEDQRRRRIEDIPSFDEGWLDEQPEALFNTPSSQLQICRKLEIKGEVEPDLVPFTPWQVTCVTCIAKGYHTPDVSGDGLSVATTARLLLLRPTKSVSVKGLLTSYEKPLLLPVQSYHLVVGDADWGHTFELVYDEALVAHYLGPVLESPYMDEASMNLSSSPTMNEPITPSVEASPKIRKYATSVLNSISTRRSKSAEGDSMKTLQVKCRTFLDRAEWVEWLEGLRGPLSHDYKRRVQEKEMEERRRVLEAFLDDTPLHQAEVATLSTPAPSPGPISHASPQLTPTSNEVLLSSAPEWMLSEARRVVGHEMQVIYDGLAVMEVHGGEVLSEHDTDSDDDVNLSTYPMAMVQQGTAEYFSERGQSEPESNRRTSILSTAKSFKGRPHDSSPPKGLYDKKVPLFAHLAEGKAPVMQVRRKSAANSSSSNVTPVPLHALVPNDEDRPLPLLKLPSNSCSSSLEVIEGVKLDKLLPKGRSSLYPSKHGPGRSPHQRAAHEKHFCRLAGTKEAPSFGRLVVVRGLHHPLDAAIPRLHVATSISNLISKADPQYQTFLEKSHRQFAALCTAVACEVLRIKEGVDVLVDTAMACVSRLQGPQGTHQVALHVSIPRIRSHGVHPLTVVSTFLIQSEADKVLGLVPPYRPASPAPRPSMSRYCSPPVSILAAYSFPQEGL